MANICYNLLKITMGVGMVEDFGKLLLRLNLGGLLLCRGVHFLLNGLDPVKQILAGHNIPDALAYGVYVGELIAPMLIVFGLFARLGGATIALIMAAAIALTYGTLGTWQTPDGSFPLETEMFYLVSGLCVALLGPGRFAVERIGKPEKPENTPE
jgi:putative oxidoreductase